MTILPAQRAQLQELIEQSKLPPTSFSFDEDACQVDFRLGPLRYHFQLSEYFLYGRTRKGYTIRMSPGSAHETDELWAPRWEGRSVDLRKHPSVVERFFTWLELLQKQVAASVDAGVSSPPKWLETVGPGRVRELAQQIRDLRNEQRELHRRVALLWQTGDPLEQAVQLALSDLGYATTPTERAANHDLTVELGNGRRFLIEVTGISDHVRKKSNKISQSVHARQDAQSGDRVLLVVNAYRETPPAQRNGPIVSDDALEILAPLRVSIISTVSLHHVWEIGLQDIAAARQLVESLYDHAGGVWTP